MLPVRKVNFFSAFDVSYKSPFMTAETGCSAFTGSSISDSAFSNFSYVLMHSFLNLLRKFNKHIHLKSESPDSVRCSEVFFCSREIFKTAFFIKKIFGLPDSIFCGIYLPEWALSFVLELTSDEVLSDVFAMDTKFWHIL